MAVMVPILNRTIVVVTRHSNGAYATTRLYPTDFGNDHAPVTTITGPNTTAQELFLPEDSVLPDGGETKVFKMPNE